MFQGKYVLKDFPKESFDSPHLIRGKDVHKELEDAVVKGTPIHKSRSFLQPLIDSLRGHSLIEAELQVCFDANKRMKSWFDKNAWCRMIFDVIATNDKESIITIDWKTGKVRRDSKDQLKLFTAGLFEKFPRATKVLTAYVWVDHPTEPPTWVEYTRDQKDDIWLEFGDRAELIQIANESGNWLEKPSFLCMFCPANIGQCSNMTAELKEKRAKYEAKSR